MDKVKRKEIISLMNINKYKIYMKRRIMMNFCYYQVFHNAGGLINLPPLSFFSYFFKECNVIKLFKIFFFSNFMVYHIKHYKREVYLRYYLLKRYFSKKKKKDMTTKRGV